MKGRRCWTLLGGRVQVIRASSNLLKSWRHAQNRPHFYTPTVLHNRGFTVGRWAILWQRDFTGRGFQ